LPIQLSSRFGQAAFAAGFNKASRRAIANLRLGGTTISREKRRLRRNGHSPAWWQAHIDRLHGADSVNSNKPRKDLPARHSLHAKNDGILRYERSFDL